MKITGIDVNTQINGTQKQNNRKVYFGKKDQYDFHIKHNTHKSSFVEKIRQFFIDKFGNTSNPETTNDNTNQYQTNFSGTNYEKEQQVDEKTYYMLLDELTRPDSTEPAKPYTDDLDYYNIDRDSISPTQEVDIYRPDPYTTDPYNDFVAATCPPPIDVEIVKDDPIDVEIVVDDPIDVTE